MSKMLTKYPNGSFHVGKMVRIFSFALGWDGKESQVGVGGVEAS